MTDASLILVVDDNLTLQRATVRVLSQAGYRTCRLMTVRQPCASPVWTSPT